MFCISWHAQGQCWSDGQSYGCSNCGGNPPPEKCRQPDKIIGMSQSVCQPTITSEGQHEGS